MKALVTGGGGFLGGHVVRQLLQRGDTVRVLGRSDYPELTTLGADCIRGDIRDRASAIRACAGVDVVFHVAAKAGIWGKPAEFEAINVDGTRKVIEACRQSGVPRLVFTSSPSVVFGKDDLCGVDESQPYPSKFLADYPRTKAAAERLVLAANGPALATVALRPHLIWGPGDPHLLPRVVDRARRGKLVQVGDGQNLVDITYVENAANAHLNACDALFPNSACSGKTYFISQGEPVRLWSWLNDILLALDVPPVTRRISFRSAYLMGAILERTFALFRPSGEPPMTRFLATQLAKHHFFSIKNAVAGFSFAPRVSTQDGLQKTIPWLRANTAKANPAPLRMPRELERTT